MDLRFSLTERGIRALVGVQMLAGSPWSEATIISSISMRASSRFGSLQRKRLPSLWRCSPSSYFQSRTFVSVVIRRVGRLFSSIAWEQRKWNGMPLSVRIRRAAVSKVSIAFARKSSALMSTGRALDSSSAPWKKRPRFRKWAKALETGLSLISSPRRVSFPAHEFLP